MRQVQGREVITLTEAADLIGRNYGHKPSVATVWRWARKGLHGHRLATIRVGRLYRTTIAAVHEFVGRLSNIDTETNATAPTVNSQARPDFTAAEIAEAQRQRAEQIAEAKRRLRQFQHRPSEGPDHRSNPRG
jgi:hypothetical protein